MDVKFLRTAIRHDVDHGSEGDIQKKRIRASEVFERYSGKKSSEECGPDEFLATHSRILAKLIGFLATVT
jgi:hypothetical protein